MSGAARPPFRDPRRAADPRGLCPVRGLHRIGLALAAAAILLVVRHFDTVQALARHGAGARARAASCASSLGDRLPACQPARRELDDLFANHVLDEGVLLASLVATNGVITYTHRLIGRASPRRSMPPRRARGSSAATSTRRSASRFAPTPPSPSAAAPASSSSTRTAATSARRELDVPAGRRDLRGRADPPLCRARADPPARHRSDPAPDGRDPAARPMTSSARCRTGRSSAPRSMRLPPVTWARSCSTSTTSRR